MEDGRRFIRTGFLSVVSDSYFAGSVTAEYGFIGGIIGGAYGWNQGQGPSAKFGKCLVDNCLMWVRLTEDIK